MKNVIKCCTVVFAVTTFISSIAFAAPVNLDLVYDGVSHKYSEEEIKISVNGNYITNFTVPPVSIDGRTLVPARAVFEAMGAQVQWNEVTEEVYILKENDIVVIKINNKNGTKNGQSFSMDTPPKIINDTTLIPVRAVSEALGCTVEWEDKSRTVSINEVIEQIEVPSNNSPIGGDTTEKPNVIVPPSEVPITPTPIPIPPASNVINSGSNSTNNFSVTDIETLSNGSVFKISASGILGKVESVNVDGNRLAIDIYNADMLIENKNIEVVSPYVTAIRSAQNQLEPVKISRVVFDFKASSSYTVTIGNDRKSVYVSFGGALPPSNVVTENKCRLSHIEEKNQDYFVINGESEVIADAHFEVNPARIIINVSATELDSMVTNELKTNNVSKVEIAKADAMNYKVTLYVMQNSDFEVINSGKETSVRIYESGFKNISYDYNSRMIVLNKKENIQSNSTFISDDYLNKKYVIKIKDNSENFGNGNLNILDDYIDNINIRNAAGETIITLNEKQIIATDISEDNDNIYIKVLKPTEKYSRVVLIDAGHGASDPGAAGVGGLTEKNVNLDLALRVYKLLENDPTIKVYMTRNSDTYPENRDRAKTANQSAHMFVSIHQNSNDSSKPNGTEVLYVNHANENSSVLNSKDLAEITLKNVLNALGTVNRGIKLREDLIVLNQTTVPAILIETLFISNPDDATRISQESIKDAFAQAVYTSIVEAFSKYNY